MKNCNRSSGFSLAEVLIASALASMVMLGVGTLISWTAQNQARAVSMTEIESYKQILLMTFNNNLARNNTIAQNQSALSSQPSIPTMACLAANAAVNCTPNDPQPFALYDSGGNLVTDSRDPASGLTLKGVPCSSFSMAGNDDCPLRYDLKWSAVCNPSGTPPCQGQQVLFTAKFLYRPSPNSTQKLLLNEDRLSIHGFYFNPETCLSRNNQVFLTNTTAADITTNFVVPPYTKNLYVEVWGGGGGGSAGSIFTGVANGTPGGSSSFGAVTGAGGAGGAGAAWSSCSWFFVSGVGFFFLWAGNPGCDGWDASPPPDPALLASISANSCSPISSTNDGGKGGVGVSANGTPYGGGGANGGSWITDCATVAEFLIPTRDPDNGGKYATATFTPATLPPGTVVPVTIGAGGTGGLGWGFLACAGFWPWPAGNGASGAVKITWE